MDNEEYFKETKKDLIDIAEEQRLKELSSASHVTYYSFSPIKTLREEIEKFEIQEGL